MIRKQIVLVIAFLALSVSAFGQDTGSVKGKVRNQEGKGLESVSVVARRDGKDIKSDTTDKKGQFEINGLTPGLYNLVFEKPGYSGGVLYDIEVVRKKKNNLGDKVVLKVDEGTLIILEASVFSPNGFSLYGAKVVIEEIDSNGGSKQVGSGYTSRDGDILFRFPVGARKYRVTASAKKAKDTKIMEVNEAAIYRTALTLDLSEEK